MAIDRRVFIVGAPLAGLGAAASRYKVLSSARVTCGGRPHRHNVLAEVAKSGWHS